MTLNEKEKDLKTNLTFLEDHSKLCKDQCYSKENIESNHIKSWEEFKKSCFDLFDNTEEDNRKIIYDKVLDLYNSDKNKYNFTYDKDKISKLYKDWKKNSLKFKKYSIFFENNIKNDCNEILIKTI